MSKLNAKQTIILVLACTVALLAIILPLTFCVFLKAPALEKPVTPTVPIITETRIYFETDIVENAQSYVFEIVSPSGARTQLRSSISIAHINLQESEQVFVNQFKIAGEYSVRCQAVGVNPNNKSAWSETKTFIYKKTLNAPVLQLTQATEKSIVWESIENATEYQVSLTSYNEEVRTFTILAINDSAGIETLNLTTFATENSISSGTYSISIVAKNSTNTNFLASDSSNVVTFTLS